MNSKPNQILIGTIILMIGALALLQFYVKFNYGTIALIAGGAAFILLYRTKKKSWSLVLGCYLCYFGLIGILKWLGLDGFLRTCVMSMFFIVPGIIFMVLYYDKNKRGLLLPSCMLISAGLLILTNQMLNLSGFKGNTFCIFMGFGLLSAYVLGKDFMSRFILYGAVCLLGLGAFAAFGLSPGFFAMSFVKLASCLVIFIGVFIIVRAVLRK